MFPDEDTARTYLEEQIATIDGEPIDPPDEPLPVPEGHPNVVKHAETTHVEGDPIIDSKGKAWHAA